MTRSNFTGGVLRRLGGRISTDEGFALPSVIGLAAVLLVMVAASLSVTVSGLKKSATDEDWNGALAAAYAGIEEYQSRLSDNSTYYKYGNPAAVFSSTSSATLSLPSGSSTNKAFGIGTTGTWASVPGSTNGASFRYEIDNSQYSNAGVLRVRSTGKVNDVTRSVVADLRQKGFIDFLYFTQYETLDPAIAGGTNCDRHAYDSPTRGSSCTDIQFGAADVINGPLHTNDTMLICGTTFNGKVTTSNPTTPIYVKPSGCANPTLTQGAITYQKPLDPPPTNSEMKKETRVDLATDVPRPGCMYTGPTDITLNADGTMTVVSPFTKVTQPSYTSGIPSASPAACGKISDLNSTAGAKITVPSQNLVYVQNVPSSTTDPNYQAPLVNPTGFTCNNKSTSTEGWKFGSLAYPMTNEVVPPTSSSTSPAYGCRNGDLYIDGTFKGAATFASENFIYDTQDIIYADTTSILGLVGNNAVWVWNPVNSSGTNLITETSPGREIDAAILSVAHTFMVQNYNDGNARGKLTIKGAIAQNFRGTVATTQSGTIKTGFAKDYNYDDRLRYTAPPKFLTPISTTYGVTQFANVPAAFKASGAAG